MLELIIKAPTHTAKLLINIAYVVYVDYIVGDVLFLWMDGKPPLELKDAVLIDNTIEQVYQRLKIMLDNHNDY